MSGVMAELSDDLLEGVKGAGRVAQLLIVGGGVVLAAALLPSTADAQQVAANTGTSSACATTAASSDKGVKCRIEELQARGAAADRRGAEADRRGAEANQINRQALADIERSKSRIACIEGVDRKIAAAGGITAVTSKGNEALRADLKRQRVACDSPASGVN